MVSQLPDAYKHERTNDEENSPTGLFKTALDGYELGSKIEALVLSGGSQVTSNLVNEVVASERYAAFRHAQFSDSSANDSVDRTAHNNWNPPSRFRYFATE